MLLLLRVSRHTYAAVEADSGRHVRRWVGWLTVVLLPGLGTGHRETVSLLLDQGADTDGAAEHAQEHASGPSPKFSAALMARLSGNTE